MIFFAWSFIFCEWWSTQLTADISGGQTESRRQPTKKRQKKNTVKIVIQEWKDGQDIFSAHFDMHAHWRCKFQTQRPGWAKNSGTTGLFAEPEPWVPGSCWAREKRSQCIIYWMAGFVQWLKETDWAQYWIYQIWYMRCWPEIGLDFWIFFHP